MSRNFSLATLLGVLAVAADASAGTVTVKVELPPAPPQPQAKLKGFLERVENPIAQPRGLPVAPYIVVALESDTPKTDASGQLPWELVGESFAKPLIIAPAGSEVVIKNVSKTARNLTTAEDPKLIPPGTLNPTGPKSFRVTETKTYTVIDKDAPHLKGTIVVVATPHVGYLDANHKVELTDVPEGAYKVRVFYRDAWVAEKPVTVPAKGKADVTIEAAMLTSRDGKK